MAADKLYPMVQVRVTGTSARKFEEVSSHLADADFALAALLRLRDLPPEADVEADVVTRFSLWSSAAIAYARIFLGGKRQPLGTAVVVGTEFEATHRGLMDFRGRQIAHPASEAEQWRTMLLLTARELPGRHVEGVGAFAMKMVGVGPEDLARTIALIEFVKGTLEQRRDDLQAALLASAQSITLDELDARADRGSAWRPD